MKSFSVATMIIGTIVATAAAAQLPEVVPQPAPMGAVAQGIEDAALSSKVREAIGSDRDLKDMRFTVDTTNSVVTLNGTANAMDEIARAVAIARAVPGVKSVTNILAVKTS